MHVHPVNPLSMPMTVTLFRSCDLDLDLMTLMFKLDLDIPKLHLHTKTNVPAQGFQRVRALQTDTQTDLTENITTTHSPLVKTPSLKFD